jgi:hypothetical protein
MSTGKNNNGVFTHVMVVVVVHSNHINDMGLHPIFSALLAVLLRGTRLTTD